MFKTASLAGRQLPLTVGGIVAVAGTAFGVGALLRNKARKKQVRLLDSIPIPRPRLLDSIPIPKPR